jgi:hypothetical protein
MTKFINIRNEDQPPIMLDVEDFAVLLECTEKRQEGLYLSDAKQGRIFDINAKSWGDGDINDVIKSIGGLNTLQPRLAHREDLYCKRLVERFADSVFSNVEGLIKMNKAAGVFYARMDDVSLVRLAGDNGLSLTFNKNAAEQYAKDLNVYYSNEYDALEGIKKVIELKNRM